MILFPQGEIIIVGGLFFLFKKSEPPFSGTGFEKEAKQDEITLAETGFPGFDAFPVGKNGTGTLRLGIIRRLLCPVDQIQNRAVMVKLKPFYAVVYFVISILNAFSMRRFVSDMAASPFFEICLI